MEEEEELGAGLDCIDKADAGVVAVLLSLSESSRKPSYFSIRVSTYIFIWPTRWPVMGGGAG